MKRLLFFAAILSIFIGLLAFFQKTTCKIVGQPTTVGPIQQIFEAPFFEALAKDSSIPLLFQYAPTNVQGFKEDYQLKFLKEGYFDLVSLRFLQNEGLEVALTGVDIPGLQENFSSARNFTEAISPFLDQNLQKNFQAKLLGTWAFGPQELFCTKPIKNLADLKGLKIRIGGKEGSSIKHLFNALGAKPIYMEYGETINALEGNLIDCGVSSYLSAESAGWFKYLPYRMNLNFGNGINGYVINLRTWNVLNNRQKQLLLNHFKDLSDRMWIYSEESYEKSLLPCSKDGSDCQKPNGAAPKMITFNRDQQSRFHQIAVESALQTWLKKCEAVDSTCKSRWLIAAKNSSAFQNLNLNDL